MCSALETAAEKQQGKKKEGGPVPMASHTQEVEGESATPRRLPGEKRKGELGTRSIPRHPLDL